MANQKHYDGWVVDASQEVSAEQAAQLPMHATAFFDSSDRLDRVELYDGSKLFRVDYYGRPYDQLRDAHRDRYPGVPFTTHETIPARAGFRWDLVDRFTASGAPEGRTVVLIGDDGLDLMEVERTADGAVREVRKYHWEGPEQLRYAVRYTGDGSFLAAHDLLYGDDLSFADVRAALHDADFFRAGLNLPPALAGTSVPS